MRSKLLDLKIRNLGCIGPEGVTISLDDIACLVGKNNVGKSTILKAYEMAQKGAVLKLGDRCKWAPEGDPTEVILDVHIPEGIGNISEEWKFVDPINPDARRIVRSRWQWDGEQTKPIRKTWKPFKDAENIEEGEWSADGNAAGLDNVFASRLPAPIRVGSLDEPDDYHGKLIKLILGPVSKTISRQLADRKSDLGETLNAMTRLVKELTESHQEDANLAAANIDQRFSEIFPNMGLQINLNMSELSIDPLKLLADGSGVVFQNAGVTTNLQQQGTGIRRAIFWGLVHVHNQLELQEKLRADRIKNINSEIKREQKKSTADRDKISALERELETLNTGASVEVEANDIALPGNILLIDEPENALHPLAVRAAQKQLYKLADDEDWQVLLTTHSPYFVNPMENHTTIVRLESSGREGRVDTNTYKSENSSFEEAGTINKLKALMQIDASVSEMFFGSFPILVEGDTEHAAFLASVIEADHQLAQRVVIVKARGKALLAPLARILRHFKVSFGVMHDADTPYTKNGDRSGIWSENGKIRAEVEAAREEGLIVNHHVSFPDFERWLDIVAVAKDKPINTYNNVSNNLPLMTKGQELFALLCSEKNSDPITQEILEEYNRDYMSSLLHMSRKMAAELGQGDLIQYTGIPEGG